MSIAPWNSFGSSAPNALPHTNESTENGNSKHNGSNSHSDAAKFETADQIEGDCEQDSRENGDRDKHVGGNGNGKGNGLHNGHQAAPTNGHRATFHRLATVRRQQGVSQRNIARRLNVDINTIRQQEEETADLQLSILYQWQKILDVPISELLIDSDAPLSPPVMERARMVKVMKTVAAIAEKAQTPSMQRLLQMLCSQLLEIMPELTDVAPWHTVGQRRTLDEFGRIVERQLPDDLFRRRG